MSIAPVTCVVCVCELGKDDQEDSVEDGMHRMQVPQTAADQALQTLWTWRRQEEEGETCMTEIGTNFLIIVGEVACVECKPIMGIWGGVQSPWLAGKAALKLKAF